MKSLEQLEWERKRNLASMSKREYEARVRHNERLIDKAIAEDRRRKERAWEEFREKVERDAYNLLKKIT
jgi:hypothetical protein